MEEKLNTLYELCETLDRELREANEKIRLAGGKLSSGDLDVIDKLTHAMKSVKTTIAMVESEDDGGYSGNYMMPRYGYAYADGSRGGNRGGNMGARSSRSYRGNSYAQRRDSMGRYTREGGYSYDDGIKEIVEEMRGMMDDLPDEKRREVQRFVDKMDRM